MTLNREPRKLTEELRSLLSAYLAEHYVDESMVVFCELAEPSEKDLAPRECLRRTSKACSEIRSLEDILKEQDTGFTERLLSLIDKTGKKDSEIYKRANISKQHFSKIRNNPHYKPTKSTALALAIALELDVDATRDLIGRAGFALANSSKFDLIIRYFIESKNYNIVEINLALYEFDQPLLGA